MLKMLELTFPELPQRKDLNFSHHIAKWKREPLGRQVNFPAWLGLQRLCDEFNCKRSVNITDIIEDLSWNACRAFDNSRLSLNNMNSLLLAAFFAHLSMSACPDAHTFYSTSLVLQVLSLQHVTLTCHLISSTLWSPLFYERTTCGDETSWSAQSSHLLENNLLY